MCGRRTIRALVCLLAVTAVAAMGGETPTDSQGRPSDGSTADVTWWYDPARGAVCWVARMSDWRSNDFVIDLDGNHSTGVTSGFQWDSKLHDFAQHRTWEAGGGGGITNESGTGPSVISESTVSPPWRHLRFTWPGVISEWFHPFVTKRTPPTDWILGVSDDDGNRSLPITRIFWVGLDRGRNWTQYDPSAFTGPTGDCIEDLPQVPVLSATIDFDPDTLNPKSQGKWVTAYIELPTGYDPRDINATTIRLNDTLAPILDPSYGCVTDPSGYITDHDGDGIEERLVKFDRTAVIALLSPGTYPIRITGRLGSGPSFEGLSDSIRVLDPRP